MFAIWLWWNIAKCRRIGGDFWPSYSKDVYFHFSFARSHFYVSCINVWSFVVIEIKQVSKPLFYLIFVKYSQQYAWPRTLACPNNPATWRSLDANIMRRGVLRRSLARQFGVSTIITDKLEEFNMTRLLIWVMWPRSGAISMADIRPSSHVNETRWLVTRSIPSTSDCLLQANTIYQ